MQTIKHGDLTPQGDENDHQGLHPARSVRNYLLAGLLVWIPIVVTIWVVRFVTGILDQSLLLLPPAWRPETLLGRYIPGLGVILSLVLLFVTGVVVRNLFGRQIVRGAESLVRRIPVIGSVYSGAKTFSETVLSDQGKSFKQVVMVEFPRKGAFSIGFVTSDNLEEAQARTAHDVTCVFVPTTPNPTSGFLILVARDEVVKMDMSVDEAFKMLLTLGVVVPRWQPPGAGETRLAPQQTAP